MALLVCLIFVVLLRSFRLYWDVWCNRAVSFCKHLLFILCCPVLWYWTAVAVELYCCSCDAHFCFRSILYLCVYFGNIYPMIVDLWYFLLRFNSLESKTLEFSFWIGSLFYDYLQSFEGDLIQLVKNACFS